MGTRFTLFKNWLETKAQISRERVDAFWKKQDAALEKNPNRWHWKITLTFMAVYLLAIAGAVIYLHFKGAK